MAIPRRYKETSIFKPDAIGDGIDGAAQTATNYISADSTGIRIANANPATATTYQHQTATSTEFYVDGVKAAEHSGYRSVIGPADTVHTELGSAGFVVSDGEGTPFIHTTDLEEVTSLEPFYSDGSSQRVTVTTGTGGSETYWNYPLTYEWEGGTSGTAYNYPPDKIEEVVAVDSGGSIVSGAIVSWRVTEVGGDWFIDIVATGDDTSAHTYGVSFCAHTGVWTGRPGLQIGTDNGSHLKTDYHSMRLVDKEGTEYFGVEDLRDENGEATLTETGRFLSSTSVQVSTSCPVSGVVSFTQVSGGSVSNVSYTLSGGTLIATSPIFRAEYTLVYKTQSQAAKAFTFGSRAAGKDVGARSVILGANLEASYTSSYAEGENNVSSGWCSHAEGRNTEAAGPYAHAEGSNTTATVRSSHAEGEYTEATSSGAHAEGLHTEASGAGAHAEGEYAVASGSRSHAQNYYTVAASDHQTAIGKFNVADTSDIYVLVIGNGTATNARSNALTVDWNGNVVAAGAPTFMGVKLIYEPGDTITGTVVSGGYVTNSTRDIRWTVPLSKPMAGSVTLTSMSAMVRMAGAYIWGSSSGRASMPVADVTCTVTPSGINCVYSGSSAISGATNNSECAVDCLFTFAVS